MMAIMVAVKSIAGWPLEEDFGGGLLRVSCGLCADPLAFSGSGNDAGWPIEIEKLLASAGIIGTVIPGGFDD